jgi:hypothetical protein
MALSTDVVLNFLADTKDLQKRLEKVSKSLKNVGKKAGVGFAAGSVALLGFAKAAQKQQEAVNSLNLALKSNNDFTEANTQALQAQASALQKTTKFGDESTIAMQSLLAQFGLTTKEILKLTPVVQDLATAQRMDVVQAGLLVAKSLGSSVNALSRYGIEITGAVGSSERLSTAVENISSKFGGQAVEAGKGFGAIDRLRNGLGDLAEAIGFSVQPQLEKFSNTVRKISEYIEQNPALTKIIGQTILWGTALAGIIAVLATGGFVLTSFTLNVLKLATAIKSSTIATKLLGYAMKGLPFAAILIAIALFATAYKTNFLGIANFTKQLFEAMKIFFEPTIKFWRQTFSEFTKFIVDWGKDFVTVFSFVFDFLSKKVNDWVNDFITVWNFLREIIGKAPVEFKGTFAIAIDEIKEAWKEAGRIITENEKKENQKRTENVVNEFIKQKQKKAEITEAEAAQILEIKKATNEAELLALEEKLLAEREQRFLDLENKIIDWENEGLAKTEILRLTKEQEKAIEEDFAGSLKAIEDKKNLFREKSAKFNTKLNDSNLQSLAGVLGQSEALNKANAIQETGIALKKALVNKDEGITKALSLPFPANIAAAATVAAAAIAPIARIAATSYAVGTDNVPNDMLANIHSGEIIVPAREAQFLRSGDLALSAPDAITNNQNSQMEINVNVEGSLVGSTPEELARSIHDIISGEITGRALTPFPVSAQ